MTFNSISILDFRGGSVSSCYEKRFSFGRTSSELRAFNRPGADCTDSMRKLVCVLDGLCYEAAFLKVDTIPRGRLADKFVGSQEGPTKLGVQQIA